MTSVDRAELNPVRPEISWRPGDFLLLVVIFAVLVCCCCCFASNLSHHLPVLPFLFSYLIKLQIHILFSLTIIPSLLSFHFRFALSTVLIPSLTLFSCSLASILIRFTLISNSNLPLQASTFNPHACLALQKQIVYNLSKTGPFCQDHHTFQVLNRESCNLCSTASPT